MLINALKRAERIPEDSDFVEEVLATQKEIFERRYWLASQSYEIDCAVERATKILEMEPKAIWKTGNQPQLAKARSITC